MSADQFPHCDCGCGFTADPYDVAPSCVAHVLIPGHVPPRCDDCEARPR